MLAQDTHKTLNSEEFHFAGSGAWVFFKIKKEKIYQKTNKNKVYSKNGFKSGGMCMGNYTLLKFTLTIAEGTEPEMLAFVCPY